MVDFSIDLPPHPSFVPSGPIERTFPPYVLQAAFTVPENDSILRTAHYTVAPKEDCAKNKGEKGPDGVRTAQNTHIERFKRQKRTLPKYLNRSICVF
jgi:hypothetical protein